MLVGPSIGRFGETLICPANRATDPDRVVNSRHKTWTQFRRLLRRKQTAGCVRHVHTSWYHTRKRILQQLSILLYVKMLCLISCVTTGIACCAWDKKNAEQGLTSHQTHYRSYRGRFLQVIWPNQQCTEGNHLVFQIRLESHQDHSTMLKQCNSRQPPLCMA